MGSISDSTELNSQSETCAERILLLHWSRNLAAALSLYMMVAEIHDCFLVFVNSEDNQLLEITSHTYYSIGHV